MTSEQLIQNGLINESGLKGEPYGKFELLKLGQTTVSGLLKAGLSATVPEKIDFPFTKYSPPKSPKSCKPDNVFIKRSEGDTSPVAIAEFKKPSEMKSADQVIEASEQGIYSASAIGVEIAIITDGKKYLYVNIPESIKQKIIIYLDEKRSLNPGVLEELLTPASIVRDPGVLAEKVWQMIWHATKEEPKACLLTFVEIFVLKFLSDNLPSSVLPEALSFYELLSDPAEFNARHGVVPIEYYVNSIRPKIKQIFPDNTIAQSLDVAKIFGLSTVISKTSVINGFSFMKNSVSSPATFNRVFMDILKEFQNFGPLNSIDPEFKLRLYETFLKKSARQQKLGQFFTPRNVVKSIIQMAQMNELPKGATVLDPACGVGGFILEPAITEKSLIDNLTFANGKPLSDIRLIGVDVDANTHILGKANLLIHLVEKIRDPNIPLSAINQLMAETFVLMNNNETLGALEYPPIDSVDLIMTNPPYVTQGSRIYKDELEVVSGTRNGQIVSEYYENTGLGLESLFLRYISGALKPGGRAFAIVPQGMLTRSETSTKNTLLEECNLLASIALPSNTFFNTPQKTYILALEKRHSKLDERPGVFCAVARTIGETLDYRRFPTPELNDLADIASQFVDYSKALKAARNEKDGTLDFTPSLPIVKVVSSDFFAAADRWDSARLWSSEELEKLGVIESATGRIDFIDEANSQLEALSEELKNAKTELEKLTAVNATIVSLSNPIFALRRGKRVRKEDCDLNPSDLKKDPSDFSVPVYSGANVQNKPLGHISAIWLKKNGIPIENVGTEQKGVLTINSNGSVGMVFVRYQKCAIHDDVTVVEVNCDDIDMEYLATQLRSSISEGNYEYEAKLYSGRMKELSVVIPIDEDKKYDLEQQKRIASAYKRFDLAKAKLAEFGKWVSNSRMKNDGKFNILSDSDSNDIEQIANPRRSKRM